jgi:hypothetical protein
VTVREGVPDHEWLVETSGDLERWRKMGRAYTFEGEALIIHGAGKFLRVTHVGDGPSFGPMERTDDLPMALVDLGSGTRTEFWPEEEHMGLPVFLPGGEAGRLLSFERSNDGSSWTYSLEFKGVRTW